MAKDAKGKKMTDAEYDAFEKAHPHNAWKIWQDWRIYTRDAAAGMTAEQIAEKYHEPVEKIKRYLTMPEP